MKSCENNEISVPLLYFLHKEIKMKSKMLILSLIIVFSIVLVACSNGNEEKKGEDGKIVLSPKSSDIKGKVL